MPLHVAEFQFRYNNRENADIFRDGDQGLLSVRAYWSYWLAIAVWVLVGICFILILIPTPIYISVYSQATEYTQQHCNAYDNFECAMFWIIGEAIFSAAFWTAAATLAIAWFTLRLKWSTDRLWIAAKDQSEIAKQSLITVQRAFVFIDSFKSAC